MLLPMLMLLFSFMRIVPLSLALLCMVGWAFMVVANTTNSLVQLMVPDEIRGRVMGFYVLVFFGSSTLGTLAYGSLAQGVSEPFAVWVAAGAFFIYFAFIWIKFPEIRLLE
jgi:predicted MFS family arabinose efflux permease